MRPEARPITPGDGSHHVGLRFGLGGRSYPVLMLNTASTTRSPVASESRTGVRTVARVFRSTPRHWVGDGFHVSTYFPRTDLPSERVSPFLLMDYGGVREFAPLARGQRGVGWHPHRGFETVTLAWEGSVAHTDNAGHEGLIGPGDVQWMTAASGILHREYHAPEFTRTGGRMHMMQLWVNLPSQDKMSPPGYQPIVDAQIPTVTLADGAGTVRVVAGAYAGAAGPARTFTPVTMLDVTLAAGGRLPVSLPADHNAMAIVLSGTVTAGAARGAAGELILFENDGGSFELVAAAEAHVLVLAGEPIDEPIVQHGPFVMNTRREIVEAIQDFNAGKFGELPE
jgi:redox-sensitive bicupin YhaK (pirin superfamily)